MPVVVRATPTVESNLMLGEKGSWGHHTFLNCFIGEGRVPECYSLYPSAPISFQEQSWQACLQALFKAMAKEISPSSLLTEHLGKIPHSIHTKSCSGRLNSQNSVALNLDWELGLYPLSCMLCNFELTPKGWPFKEEVQSMEEVCEPLQRQLEVLWGLVLFSGS